MAPLPVDLECVELHQVRLLRPLDLAVEVWATGAVGPQFDPVAAQHVEKLMADEFTAAVALDPLEGEGKARKDARLEEVGG